MMLTLVITLALAGPAQEPSKPEAGGRPEEEPCSLLPRADVEAALGPLRHPPKTEPGLLQEKRCQYVNEKGAWLTMSVQGAERWDFLKGLLSENDFKSIPGLGDEAFSARRGTDAEMYVRKGKRMLEVRGSAGMAVSRTIAEKAAARF